MGEFVPQSNQAITRTEPVDPMQQTMRTLVREAAENIRESEKGTQSDRGAAAERRTNAAIAAIKMGLSAHGVDSLRDRQLESEEGDD